MVTPQAKGGASTNCDSPTRPSCAQVHSWWLSLQSPRLPWMWSTPMKSSDQRWMPMIPYPPFGRVATRQKLGEFQQCYQNSCFPCIAVGANLKLGQQRKHATIRNRSRVAVDFLHVALQCTAAPHPIIGMEWSQLCGS